MDIPINVKKDLLNVQQIEQFCSFYKRAKKSDDNFSLFDIDLVGTECFGLATYGRTCQDSAQNKPSKKVSDQRRYPLYRQKGSEYSWLTSSQFCSSSMDELLQNWDQIDWIKIEKNVRELQNQIASVSKRVKTSDHLNDWQELRVLQAKMINSYDNLLFSLNMCLTVNSIGNRRLEPSSLEEGRRLQKQPLVQPTMASPRNSVTKSNPLAKRGTYLRSSVGEAKEQQSCSQEKAAKVVDEDYKGIPGRGAQEKKERGAARTYLSQDNMNTFSLLVYLFVFQINLYKWSPQSCLKFVKKDLLKRSRFARIKVVAENTFELVVRHALEPQFRCFSLLTFDQKFSLKSGNTTASKSSDLSNHESIQKICSTLKRNQYIKSCSQIWVLQANFNLCFDGRLSSLLTKKKSSFRRRTARQNPFPTFCSRDSDIIGLTKKQASIPQSYNLYNNVFSESTGSVTTIASLLVDIWVQELEEEFGVMKFINTIPMSYKKLYKRDFVHCDRFILQYGNNMLILCQNEMDCYTKKNQLESLLKVQASSIGYSFTSPGLCSVGTGFLGLATDGRTCQGSFGCLLRKRSEAAERRSGSYGDLASQRSQALACEAKQSQRNGSPASPCAAEPEPHDDLWIQMSNIKEGFTFINLNFRYDCSTRGTYSQKTLSKEKICKLIILPSKRTLQKHKLKLRSIFVYHRGKKVNNLINKVNPIVREWAMFYSQFCPIRVFSKLDFYLFTLQKRYAFRTHPKKSKSWSISRYFNNFNSARPNDKWVFGDKNTSNYMIKHRWIKMQK